MDAELKAKWVKALRSGEYKQGQFFLERDGVYCCMGVLAKEMGDLRPDKHGSFTASCYAVIRDAGIPDSTMRTLAGLNDTERRSFSEIADYIEANL